MNTFHFVYSVKNRPTASEPAEAFLDCLWYSEWWED